MADTPFKLFTTDIVAGDEVFTYDETPSLRRLVENWRAEHKDLNNGKILEAGGKTTLTKEQFEAATTPLRDIKEAQSERYLALDHHDRPFYTAGGSSANTVCTMNEMLGPKVLQTTFLGVNGGKHQELITDAFAKARVDFVSPENVPANSEAATSIVIKLRQDEKLHEAKPAPKPDRLIFTYSGNVKEIMKPEDVIKAIEKAAPQAVLVQGSLRKKMTPEITDAIITHCHEHNIELWLAAPTQAHFTNDEREALRYILPSASVFLSNDSELKAMTGKTSYDHAVKELQTKFQERVQHQYGIKKGKIVPGKTMREPVAMITRADQGCDIIFADDKIEIPARHVGIVNSLGAGDTSYAGFLSGMILNRDKINAINAQLYDEANPPDENQQKELRAAFHEIAKEAGEMAMALASEKLRENAARLENPGAALETARPDLAAKYGIQPSSGKILPPTGSSEGTPGMSLRHWGTLLTPNPFAKDCHSR